MSKVAPGESDGICAVGDPVRSDERQGRCSAQEGCGADAVDGSCRDGEPAADAADELGAFLAAVEYDGELQVLQTLKQTEFEVTEKVARPDGSGEFGTPLVRKKLRVGTGLGSAYRTLYEACEHGQAFRYLPRIYDCYELKDEQVVLMEYLPGETMQQAVRRCGPSPELAESVFPLVCRAVSELHESFDPPIIHRDLKPSNIILSWDRATLIDFGIARVYSEGSESDTVRFGTREYAPPEQFGFGQTDVRSDVYSLGMLLFYLLTERAASAADRKQGFACPGVPAEFAKVISVACAFDPDARYAGASALERAFLQAAAAYRARTGVAPSAAAAVASADPSGSPQRVPAGNGGQAEAPQAPDPLRPAPVVRDAFGLGGRPGPAMAAHNANNPGGRPEPAAAGGASLVAGAAQRPEPSTAASASFVPGSTQQPVPPKSLRARICAAANRIPIGVGLAWNVVLGLVWLLLVSVSVACCFFPQPNIPEYHYPLWVRMVEYLLFLAVSVTCICYELADRRLIRRRFPLLRRYPLWAEFLVVACAIPFALALLMSFCMQWAGV